MCCSFQHGCTQHFVARSAVLLLHCRVVLASFCWEITGGHTQCQENVGIIRETGRVLVAMNSDPLMVGLMKSMSGTLSSSIEFAMSYIAWTPERLSKTPGPWPAWSSQIGQRYWKTSASLKHLPRCEETERAKERGKEVRGREWREKRDGRKNGRLGRRERRREGWKEGKGSIETDLHKMFSSVQWAISNWVKINSSSNPLLVALLLMNHWCQSFACINECNLTTTQWCQ